MSDPYDVRPQELAQFYAERMRAGFGPAAERKIGWIQRDADAAGDRRRVQFWQQVRDAISMEGDGPKTRQSSPPASDS
jgi:hypothetical protein